MERDFNGGELAMRVLLLVQRAQRSDPHFIIRDAAANAMEQFGLSRATAYRLVRKAIDVLCIPYDHDEIRRQRTLQCVGDASSARMMQRRAA